jgi:hypothetical protein
MSVPAIVVEAPQPLAIDRLIDDVRAYTIRARSEATRRAYSSDREHFERWCREHTREPYPASPQTLSLYLASMAQWAKTATIGRRLVAINLAHKHRGIESWTAHELVRETLRGIRRSLGTAQTKKAALSIKSLRRISRDLGDGIKA